MPPPNRPKSTSAEAAELARRVDALDRAVHVPVCPVLTADPPMPVEGQMWILSTTGEFCYHVNGTTLRVLGV